MDNSIKKLESLNNKIKEIKEELPNISIPSMGIINDNQKIDINGKDYLLSKSVKEE